MSGSKYLDALSAERRHAAMLRNVVYAVAGLGALATWVAWQVPKKIDVHLLPSVTAGTTVHVADGESVVPPANVYGFAYYIWQQINRWNQDGAKDYGQQVFRMQNYVTPRCVAQLTADMESRQRAGELRNRTRQISEIPGFTFASNRVIADAAGSTWTVFLDMQVQETFRGDSVKDVFIRYPIRVVRFDIDRERNPWQLAVDCYGTNRPARLSEADLRGENPATREKQLKVPTLPSEIAPAALPDTTPIDAAPANAAPVAKPAAQS